MCKNAIYFLRNMPHKGLDKELIEACRALGFDIKTSLTTSSVRYSDRVVEVATITGEVLQINSIVAERLVKIMSPVTQEQEEAFNKVLSKLERDNIAVHEAGHAVAAFDSKLDISFVRLGEVSEMELCSSCNMDSLDYHCPHDVEVLQEVWAAGAAAEKIVFGNYRRHGFSQDRNDINSMEKTKLDRAGKCFPDDIDVFDKYLGRAKNNLKRNMVEAIAEALKEKSCLEGKEVKTILRRM